MLMFMPIKIPVFSVVASVEVEADDDKNAFSVVLFVTPLVVDDVSRPVTTSH